MQTVCKFVCESASPKTTAGPHEATFRAVYQGSPENERFFQATPAGYLSLFVVREQHFEAGKEYYVTIAEAPRPATA